MRYAGLFLLVLLTSCIGSTSASPSPRQTNIIFILADDLGWGEPGCYGNTFNETPHIDQLAREGMRFTHAYAAAPVCSPYRAAFLTGQVPARVGITDFLRPDGNALSTDHVTIAEALKSRGYVTGMIGKWHLTGYRYHGAKQEVRAVDHGFDEELVSEIKGVGNGIIRRHCTGIHPSNIHEELPNGVLVQMVRMLGQDEVDHLLTFDFLSRIDWDLFQKHNNGGCAFELCRRKPLSCPHPGPMGSAEHIHDECLLE